MSSDPLMDAAGSNAGLAPRLLCQKGCKIHLDLIHVLQLKCNCRFRFFEQRSPLGLRRDAGTHRFRRGYFLLLFPGTCWQLCTGFASTQILSQMQGGGAASSPPPPKNNHA